MPLFGLSELYSTLCAPSFFLPLGSFGSVLSDWLSATSSGNYVETAINVVKYIQLNSPDQTIFLTGHSLGAGVSNMVGAHLKVQSVGFEGPGILEQRKKFDFSLEDADRYTFNTYAEADPVPFMDYQAGNVQQIYPSCDSIVLGCHYMSTVVKDLRAKCGDFTARAVGSA